MFVVLETIKYLRIISARPKADIFCETVFDEVARQIRTRHFPLNTKNEPRFIHAVHFVFLSTLFS
jgi:hypothetical protein